VSFFDYPGTEPDGTTAQTSGLLDDASAADWADVRAAMTTRDLRDGEILFAPGDGQGALCLVLSGVLEVLAPAARGAWKPVASVGAGSVLGELAFLDGGPHPTLARAAGTASVAELSHDGFSALAARRPDLAVLLAMDLGRILAGRLR
jgi:SulP family sulfate permease